MDKIPILKLGDILLVSIQVDINDKLALTLQDDLSQMIANTRSRGVLIDISALDIVDSFMGRVLTAIAVTSKILGARTVIVGMKPAVAITLVELGLALHGMSTALNVEKGMKLLNAEIKSGIIYEPKNRENRKNRDKI